MQNLKKKNIAVTMRNIQSQNKVAITWKLWELASCYQFRAGQGGYSLGRALLAAVTRKL